MKNILLPLLIATIICSSCLKDQIGMDPALSNNVIEFANTGANVSPAGAVFARFSNDVGALNPGDTSSFNINLSYSGAGNAPEDITVNMTIDTDALAAYNEDQKTDYVLPPASTFKLPLTGVIKKGTQTQQLVVSIKRTDDFNFNVNYAFPLKITTVSSGVISGNYGTAVYSFAARNQYDGIYVMTGTLSDHVSSGLTGKYPLRMQLITYSGNSIALYDTAVAKNYGHPILSGTSDSYYGSFSPIFYFDATGNVTSVSNYYGQLSGPSKRSAELDPTGVNKITFGDDGKVAYFEVSYIMTQNNSPRTYFTERFTYAGSR